MSIKFMPEQQAIINELAAKYHFPVEELKRLIISGMQGGISFKGAVIGFRMTAAQHCGHHEYFTVEDMMEVTGGTREEIIAQIEELKKDHPNEFIEIDRSKLN